MSEPQALDGRSVAPVPFDWKRHIGANFDVDYAEAGDDIIYQFWPLDGEADLRGGRVGKTPRFALIAEQVFAELLPEDAQVEADMIDIDEQLAIAKHHGVVEGRTEILEQRLLRPHEASIENIGDLPVRPTLYIRVREMLASPAARDVLIDQLFTKLDSAIVGGA